ncbi:MAG: hypothetical protein LWX83_17810 [Anaerolineae bacterium]|nr:hypothetical protein [Anaerolineae bacterium]
MNIDSKLHLAEFSRQSLWLTPEARFQINKDIADGAWLAVYTPLDGAMLLTSLPPAGFLGAPHDDLQIQINGSSARVTLGNLAGLDLEYFTQPGQTASAFSIIVKARNRTANPLPLALACSWQDDDNETIPQFIKDNQSASLLFGSGVKIKAVCSHPRPHYTYCCGWNPQDGGEEVWDDFFASGELGNQTYTSHAATLACHCINNPSQEIELSLNFSDQVLTTR